MQPSLMYSWSFGFVWFWIASITQHRQVSCEHISTKHPEISTRRSMKFLTIFMCHFFRPILWNHFSSLHVTAYELHTLCRIVFIYCRWTNASNVNICMRIFNFNCWIAVLRKNKHLPINSLITEHSKFSHLLTVTFV